MLTFPLQSSQVYFVVSLICPMLTQCKFDVFWQFIQEMLVVVLVVVGFHVYLGWHPISRVSRSCDQHLFHFIKWSFFFFFSSLKTSVKIGSDQMFQHIVLVESSYAINPEPSASMVNRYSKQSWGKKIQRRWALSGMSVNSSWKSMDLTGLHSVGLGQENIQHPLFFSNKVHNCSRNVVCATKHDCSATSC